MGGIIYENPLSDKRDIEGFRMEGTAGVSFERGAMRLYSELSPELGQKANYVFWCPVIFPADIAIEWNFRPVAEPGLAIMFFAAQGIDGEDIFSPSLSARDGQYPQYHHGDINAFHVSYFRRKEPDERAFHTCNLRKSYGFHLVAQGADPIPDADSSDDAPWYRIKIEYRPELVTFSVNDLTVFRFEDDGETFGKRLSGGRIGFRQLSPMTGEYRDLRVSRL